MHKWVLWIGWSFETHPYAMPSALSAILSIGSGLSSVLAVHLCHGIQGKNKTLQEQSFECEGIAQLASHMKAVLQLRNEEGKQKLLGAGCIGGPLGRSQALLSFAFTSLAQGSKRQKCK